MNHPSDTPDECCPVCFGDGTIDDVPKVRADAQALADVWTLDDWAREDDDRYYVVGPQYYGKSWYCTLWHVEQKREAGPFTGATPDEARAKAAAWVREQKRG